MSVADFLFELGTEELPPTALNRLSEQLAQLISQGCHEQNLQHGTVQAYASPRRLALWIRNLQCQQPDEPFERRGPSLKQAFDAQGQPTKACVGFAKACDVSIDDLDRISDKKGQWLVYRGIKAGLSAEQLLPDLVNTALQQLPIAKRMRWGDRKVSFVRPVHWAVMLLGEQVITADILGVRSGGCSYGHRVHAPDAIELKTASEYETLLQQGYVRVHFAKRRQFIQTQAQQLAAQHQLSVVLDPELLDEVTALSEWPVALIGQFDQRFLALPTEALISSMQSHQKYFHTLNEQGKIQPYFIFIANLKSQDPQQIVAGNEKVIRPRLADAEFFWNKDKQQPLIDYLKRLSSVVFQQQLGSLRDKTERIRGIAVWLAEQQGAELLAVERAASLCKADLVTDLVGEFDTLQGIAGYYYARNDGESEAVATAIQEHYLPRFSGDILPQSLIGSLIAIADRIDTLTGLFGIGQPPSGGKDPFALRRAALGIVRIILHHRLDLSLDELVQQAIAQYGSLITPSTALTEQVRQYILERLSVSYADQAIEADVIASVRTLTLTNVHDIDRRIQAVHQFKQDSRAIALVAANKRVVNILEQAKSLSTAQFKDINPQHLTEPAEIQLHQQLQQLTPQLQQLATQQDYLGQLAQLSTLHNSITDFFDQVMVNADDPALRDNRLSLLAWIRSAFLQVADISQLQLETTSHAPASPHSHS